MGTFNVSIKTLTDRVSMEVVYTPRALDEISVEIAEVNRPGLFLAGYYDYFDKLRLQIMGLAEMNFLSGLTAEKRYEALEQLFRQQPPAVIVCRSEELTPFPEMQELAQKHDVALLRSNETTCTLMGSLISVASAKASWPSSWSSAAIGWWQMTPWSCARCPTVRSWVLPRRTSATSLSCAASASSTWLVCTAWVLSS